MTISLNYTKVGNGPNLVIAHGLLGSASNWRTVAQMLAPNFTIYLLDLRNHGESPWAQSMTYLQMADDIANFLAAQNIKKTHVIGHSMGGKVAMSFALKHGDMLDRLVIADITPKSYQHSDSHRRYIQAMLDIDLSTLSGGRKQAQDFLIERLTEPKPVVQFLLQNLVFKNNQYQWRINLTSLEKSLDELMQKIDFDEQSQSKVKSLFIYGKNSNYLQTADHDLIYKLFPVSTIKGLDDAGHWLHAEQPRLFIETVKEFLLT